MLAPLQNTAQSMSEKTSSNVQGFNQASLIHDIVNRSPEWQNQFSKLVQHYRPYLYARCLKRLGNPMDVEDVLQEVFVSVHRYLPGFEGRSSLTTWITKIADNQCTLYQRKQHRYWMTEHIEELIDLHLRDESKDRQNLVKGEMDKLIGNLPHSAREILALRYWADYSIQEIANILGIGRSAAKMRTHRALKDCQQILLKEQAWAA
jgi:RNA polymerase sigma-70 factor (ECF subfamily)